MNHLQSTLAYAHGRGVPLVIHTKFGRYVGTIDGISHDAITLRSDQSQFPALTTIAVHAIHVVEWCDASVACGTEPQTADSACAS